MAEMTPDWLNTGWGKAIENAGLTDMVKEIVKEAESAAVQAEHERTREACAMIARRRAQMHADDANSLKKNGRHLKGIYEAHRANEAKEIEDEIRAMPEQDTERGKEPQIKTPKPEPLPWRIGKVSFY